MYTDRPRPGGGYILAIMLLLCLIAVLVAFLPSPWFVKPLLAFPVLLLVLSLHAAFATRYSISDGVLELRCGLLMPRKRIPVRDIRGPQRVRFNARVLGWGMGARGYCNRIGDGVRFQHKGIDYYCSPGAIP